MSKSGFDGLSRPIEEMPPFVERALTERDLLASGDRYMNMPWKPR